MRVCVLIPTYDNHRTLESVVLGAQVECPDVFVVDDGSRPETRAILSRVPGVIVLRHQRNRGKGAALRTGFEAAAKRGFTHAITLDSDGQHLPEDIPSFTAAVTPR